MEIKKQYLKLTIEIVQINCNDIICESCPFVCTDCPGDGGVIKP